MRGANDGTAARAALQFSSCLGHDRQFYDGKGNGGRIDLQFRSGV